MQTTATTRRASAMPASGQYDTWTIEELRAFAAQLQLRDAHTRSRGELLDILTPRRPGGREHAAAPKQAL